MTGEGCPAPIVINVTHGAIGSTWCDTCLVSHASTRTYGTTDGGSILNLGEIVDCPVLDAEATG